MNRTEELKALLTENGYSVDDSGKINFENKPGFDFGKFSDLLPILEIVKGKFETEITNSIVTKTSSKKSDLKNLDYLIGLAKGEIDFPELGRPLLSLSE